MFNSIKSRASALFFALVAAFVAVPAMAQDSVGDVVSAAITATNPQITAVIAAMAGALVIILAWQLIRRAFGGK